MMQILCKIKLHDCIMKKKGFAIFDPKGQANTCLDQLMQTEINHSIATLPLDPSCPSRDQISYLCIRDNVHHKMDNFTPVTIK